MVVADERDALALEPSGDPRQEITGDGGVDHERFGRVAHARPLDLGVDDDALGHVEVGVGIAHEILRRLRFSNEDCAQIVALVENHMRFGDIEKMKASTLKRFFRLPHFDEHLELHRIDSLSSHGDLSLYEFARQRREELPDEVVRPPLLVTGRDLIAAGYTPGPRFKELLALVEDAQLEGRIHTTEEGLEFIRREFRG